VIKVDKGVLRPQLLAQFFAGYDVAASLDERQKNLQRLLLQLDSAAVFAQLAHSFPLRTSQSG